MNYKQLIDSQRHQIEAYPKANFTVTQIAMELGVHKSTIGRELKRNIKQRSYTANHAITVSQERKKESYRHHVLDNNMKRCIDEKSTQNQWSPEQVKGC